MTKVASETSSLRVFSQDYFAALHDGAAASKRARHHAVIHADHEEPCQRLFIALRPDSYIPPHRHMLDPKNETLIAIDGLMAFVMFDDNGLVLDILIFGSQADGRGTRFAVGVDTPPGLWHSVVTLSPTAVLFEAKSGPFRPELAKEPCEWAPPEGSAEAERFLLSLRNAAFEKLAQISA